MPNIFAAKNAAIFWVVILLAATPVASEDATPIDFDPFGSGDANAPSTPQDMIDQSPIIPQIEFSNNEISMAFQIISDATGWSIFPTAEVSRAKVSLWAKDITAMELLDTVIMLAGFIYHREGDIISVMTYDEYMQHYGLAKKVIPLTYADAASVLAVIKPFLTKLGKSVVHQATNTVVLYEADANLELIAGIIEKLDTSAENIVVEVISLEYVNCESLVSILQGVFTSQKKNAKNKSSGVADTTSPAQAEGSKQVEKDSARDTLVPYEQMGIYAVSHANQLVVVGTKSDIEKVKELVAKIDVFGDNMVLEVISLEYADAQVLAETLQKVFSGQESKDNLTNIQKGKRTSDRSSEGTIKTTTAKEDVLFTPLSQVGIYSIGRTNQLIIKAFRGDVDRLKILVTKLDTYVEPTTKTYHFVYVDAAEIYNGLERMLYISGRYGTYGRSGGRGGREVEVRGGLTLIEKTNSILLTGPPSVHRVMTSICESVDVPGIYETGMIRVYKIENADVDEIAKTIQDLLRDEGGQKGKPGEPKFKESVEAGVEPGPTEMAETEEFVPQIQAKVSVNKATNSIVIQATIRQHRELEKLIGKLDIRRKQVFVKAMIIEVATTDDMDLGVELDYFEGDVLAFTSFGLSSIDPAVGVREIVVAPGGTAAVLRPNKVQAILKALQGNDNVRIQSAPQVLVNDNAVGTINSIAEEPTRQTHQGETATTTSFGEYVTAGTQFFITPHISESDYLRVEYQIILNSFGEQADPELPPSRSTSNIQSEATVPDGYTIVVGGIQSSNESESVDKVPLLGDIPLLGVVFRNTVIRKQYITTYLFITTTIIKSEDFGDLKDISEKALKEVEKDGNEQTPDAETGNAEQTPDGSNHLSGNAGLQ